MQDCACLSCEPTNSGEATQKAAAMADIALDCLTVPGLQTIRDQFLVLYRVISK